MIQDIRDFREIRARTARNINFLKSFAHHIDSTIIDRWITIKKNKKTIEEWDDEKLNYIWNSFFLEFETFFYKTSSSSSTWIDDRHDDEDDEEREECLAWKWWTNRCVLIFSRICFAPNYFQLSFQSFFYLNGRKKMKNITEIRYKEMNNIIHELK